MKLTPVKTRKVVAGSGSIFALLNESLSELKDGSIVAITSKVVSICENRVVPIDAVDKEELVISEADYYLPNSFSKYNYAFTVNHNTLIANSGIDESNGGDNYILWPKDPQKSASDVREYLSKRFNLKRVGVLITDSSVYPMRYGTLVIPLAHSGFLARHDYRGKPDLFGRPFKVSISSVAGGLAAAAGLVMGEGTEQTPVVIMEDLPFVEFQDRDPTQKELDDFYIPILKDDLFAPFLGSVKWLPGKRK